MADLAFNLEKIIPSAKYRGSLTDNTEESYIALIWEDEREKPDYITVLELQPIELTIKDKIQQIETLLTQVPLFYKSIFGSTIEYCITELLANPSVQIVQDIIIIIQKYPIPETLSTKEISDINNIKLQFINILQA